MYDNRGNNRFGGGRGFRRPSFGKRDFSDRQMHQATCSKCGADCQLPFRPTGERPVYCDNCFKNNRSSDYNRQNDRNDRGKYNNFENKNENKSGVFDEQLKKQFETLNWKLDKILKIISPVTKPSAVLEEKIEKKVLVFKPKKPLLSPKKVKSKVKKTAIIEV